MKNTAIKVNGLEIVGFSFACYVLPIKRKSDGSFIVCGLCNQRTGLVEFLRDMHPDTQGVDVQGNRIDLDWSGNGNDIYWGLVREIEPKMSLMLERYHARMTRLRK